MNLSECGTFSFYTCVAIIQCKGLHGSLHCDYGFDLKKQSSCVVLSIMFYKYVLLNVKVGCKS